MIQLSLAGNGMNAAIMNRRMQDGDRFRNDYLRSLMGGES